MSLVRINWKPDVKERRKFGAAMIVGFGLIGLVLNIKGHAGIAVGCWIFGAAAGVLGLTGTAVVLPFYWAWMGVAFVMGNIMSRLILTVFYYTVMTPVSLVMRLKGRDRLMIRKRASSYWMTVSRQPSDYERQF